MMIVLFMACVAVDPGCISVPECRYVGLVRGSRVLQDIESRMPANHGYEFSDPMTWAHETSHGISSRLRMQHGAGCNVFYCLDGKAFVVREPKGSLWNAGSLVPQSLRGNSFQLYFGEQRRYWDDTPTYVLDEWNAYTNGSLCGQELDVNGWHYELLQAIQFSVYAIAVAKSISETDPNYDHTALRAFIAWNSERTMSIWRSLEATNPRGLHVDQIRAYLEEWESGESASGLRAFAKSYLR